MPAARRTTTTQHPERYTDPDLRQQIKDDITNSDKGGPSGQWTLRKAQLTASEYEAAGGEYNGDKDHRKADQKNLNHTDYDHSPEHDDQGSNDESNNKPRNRSKSTKTNQASNRSTRGSKRTRSSKKNNTQSNNSDNSSSEHNSSSDNGEQSSSKRSKQSKSTTKRTRQNSDNSSKGNNNNDSDKSDAEERDERYFNEGKHEEDNRCQPGYEPVPGKEPYSKGSCRKIQD